MKKRSSIPWILAGMATVPVAVNAAPVTSLSVADVSGQAQRPLDETRKQGNVATVFFFVATDCPIANRFAPEINRISRDYKRRKVAFYIVQVNRQLNAVSARAHARAYRFSMPILLDRQHKLVKFCGASVTPEVAVLSPAGKVLYRGRIDDRYAALGRPRARPSKHDLRLALDAVCAGKPIATPRTTALGCYIEG